MEVLLRSVLGGVLFLFLFLKLGYIENTCDFHAVALNVFKTLDRLSGNERSAKITIALFFLNPSENSF
jgi:hypothetical protein